MASVMLEIIFQTALSSNTESMPIQRIYSHSEAILNTVFQVGVLPTSVQIPIQREFLPGGKQFKIMFQQDLPVKTIEKPVQRVYENSRCILSASFVTKATDDMPKEIWRFVKWTTGGPFTEKYYILRNIEKPFLSVDPLPILPRLRGQAYPDKKRPDYHTIIKQSPSAIAKTYESWHYPRWYIELTYEFMAGNAQGSDYRKLLDFFVARRGSLSDFWYQDPDDNATENELIGMGDGMQRSFQLCRTYCGYQEPIFGLNADYPLKLTVAGAVQTPDKFFVSNTGLLTFKTVTPAEGAEIRASFHFFYRCRFTEDMAEFEQFAAKLWTLKSLSMVTTL